MIVWFTFCQINGRR